MSDKLRIAFMGSPDFVVPTLEALIDHPQIEIACVYTQPPRPKGRGKDIQNTPVHDAALKHTLEVRTPENFKDSKDIEDFQNLNPDVAIVAAYGMMLPEEILTSPKHGCINIHPSLLPRWRGVSPIQFALWKGDSKTGVTVMSLVKEMDAGPTLAQGSIPITGESTAQSLSDILWPMGTKLLIEVLEKLISTGKLAPTDQPQDGVTFCHKLTKDHGRIDWTQSTQEIDLQIRALNPWPGTWTILPDNKRLKILKATSTNHEHHEMRSGFIHKDGCIMCGDKTALQLETVQPEGKTPMDIDAAMNGGYLIEGDILS